MRRLRIAALAAALVAWTGLCGPLSAAETYPAKPIRLLVGYAAGGSTDVVARIVGQRLSQELGQPIIIDNRPGAGATLASQMAANANPDGYTLFMATIANTINTSLYKSLSFDFERDFAPITLVATVPNVLVVNPSVPAPDLARFIALVKSKPNDFAFASSGNGSSIHLSGELFNQVAGTRLVHVPYKGSAPAIVDLLGGQVQSMFDNLSSSLPYIKAGKLRALAVTSAKRSPSAPDIPTMAEAGLSGCEVDSWFALVAPAKTPPDIVARLNAATVKVLSLPEIKTQLDAIGVEPAPGTADGLAAFIQAETVKWRAVVTASGAKID